MTKRGWFLTIDANLPIALNVQLKEQIKWLIGLEIIKPGEYLPTTMQLAGQLQLNRNTINWVYTQLRDEGIVLMQKGKGTRVTDGTKIEELISQKKAMLTFIENAVHEASEQGMDLEDVFLSGFAFLQLFHTQLHKRNLRILFIECHEHDYTFYRNEIERLTGGHVQTVFLENIAVDDDCKEVMNGTDIIITTLNHDYEVRKRLLPYGKKIVTIGAAADTSVLIEIAQIEPGSKIGFVCLGTEGGRWMSERVEDAGIKQIVSIPGGMSNRNELLHTLNEVHRVYASPVVYKEVMELAPDKTALYSLKLEKSSEALLKGLSNPDPH